MNNEIKKVFDAAQSCKRCYGDIPIYVPDPDPRSGKQSIKIMFINERPGRLGTGASGLVSIDNNDPTARQFKACFEQLGLSIEEIFSTNACLCHPKQEGYTDTVPSTVEIRNCPERKKGLARVSAHLRFPPRTTRH